MKKDVGSWRMVGRKNWISAIFHDCRFTIHEQIRTVT